MKKINQSGQIIVILLLVMLVILSVVLAITQRTTTDLSSSTETEQATKAYSAAEAGLEKAQQSGGTTPIGSQTINLSGNGSQAVIQNSGLLPVPGSQISIEYPPIGKESIAQFWLTDPNTPANNYNQTSFYIYFGNPASAMAYDDALNAAAQNISTAIEVNVITQVTSGPTVTYNSQRTFYDSLSSRASNNNFINVTTPSTPLNCTGNHSTNTILKNNSIFQCRVLVTISGCSLPSCIPQLVRVRLLYANLTHKIAIVPFGAGSFPPQVELYTSTGKSGQSQKTLQVFRIKDMLPPWLDFAIFSVNDILK